MFKDKIKELRKNKKYTQDDLANKLLISRQSISKWENGLSYPTRETLKSICEEFDVEISDLLDSEEIMMLALDNNKNMNKISKKIILFFISTILVLIIIIICIIIIINKIDKNTKGDVLNTSSLVGFIILDYNESDKYYANIDNYNIEKVIEQNNYPYRYLKINKDNQEWLDNMMFKDLIIDDQISHTEDLNVYIMLDETKDYSLHTIEYDSIKSKYYLGSSRYFSSNAIISVTMNFNSKKSTFYNKDINFSITINFDNQLSKVELIEYDVRYNKINELILNNEQKYSLNSDTMYFIIKETYIKLDEVLYQKKIEVRYSEINRIYIYKYKEYKNGFAFPISITIDTIIY